MIRKEGVTILMRLISPEKISSFFVQQDFYFLEGTDNFRFVFMNVYRALG